MAYLPKRKTNELPLCTLWGALPCQDNYEVKQEQYEAPETVS
jgi:hypothetical protein